MLLMKPGEKVPSNPLWIANSVEQVLQCQLHALLASESTVAPISGTLRMTEHPVGCFFLELILRCITYPGTNSFEGCSNDLS